MRKRIDGRVLRTILAQVNSLNSMFTVSDATALVVLLVPGSLHSVSRWFAYYTPSSTPDSEALSILREQLARCGPEQL